MQNSEKMIDGSNPNLSDMVLIAGPCSAETEEQTLETAKQVASLGIGMFRAGVWKPRTKPGGFEGRGGEALRWLQEVRTLTGMEPAVEVATPQHLSEALDAGVRLLWIGSRTATDPFAVQAIADGLAALPEDKKALLTVLVKNPVNPDLELWIGAIERIRMSGVGNIMAVHRGFSAYGKHIYRNQPCWAIPIELKRRLEGVKVICDPSHIAGKRELVAPLARQAMEMGFDGLMIETHCCPESALSDSRQQLTPGELSQLLSTLRKPAPSAAPEGMEELRGKIDEVDDGLLELLARRMEISEQLGAFKRNRNIPIVQPERYNALMERRVAEAAKMGLSPSFMKRLLALIHEESVRRQVES